MQHPGLVRATESAPAPAFTVEFRGLQIQCDSVEHVVEAVQALAPLKVGDRVEREVPVPRAERAITVVSASPVATAVHDLFRDEPRWRRPVEIMRALRKRGVRAKYTNVYAALRYGDFVKRGTEWNTAESA